jgi:RNA polymerase sigma-70 factor, ECF subfamily
MNTGFTATSAYAAAADSAGAGDNEALNAEGLAQGSVFERVRQGDVRAFGTLVDDWWKPLVRYAQHKLGTQDAAEDVVQEVFVRVWVGRGSLRAGKSPRGYLYRLAHNLAVDELRRRAVRRNNPWISEAHGTPPATPAEVFALEELTQATACAINALPERRREVFILGQYHELSYREIGEVLGIASRTVANHMTLALGELRGALEPFLDRERKQP